ncbi:MAG: MFS transporter [Variovorax sp.]|nr:MFS transporter [Variovorax sp.]
MFSPSPPPSERPSSRFGRWLLPAGAAPEALPLLLARGLRAFGDGYMAVLLPVYRLDLWLGPMVDGVVSTVTMLSSALATLGVGALGHRFASNRLLKGAGLLMAATGLGFACLSSFWPLLTVAFVGTLNPSSGDVSVFLPLEHARLAGAADGHARTTLFARYSVLGALASAFGALAAGVPDGLMHVAGFERHDVLRGMFVLSGAIGLAVFWLYRRFLASGAAAQTNVTQRLEASRPVVVKLAAFFSVDAFAGGLVINSLLALWLFERFGFSLVQAGAFFFWTGLLSAASQLAAPVVARRIGLLNTMVFTHIPANICLVLAALVPSLPLVLGLLFVRSALSQMDMPTRTAYVMAVVTRAERAAAASFTAVPRSLAAALSPTLSGAFFAAGWLAMPLIGCGVLKFAYDLALWRAMRLERIEAPEAS